MKWLIMAFKNPGIIIKICTHLKLCLAGAIHNFKWEKITEICQAGR